MGLLDDRSAATPAPGDDVLLTQLMETGRISVTHLREQRSAAQIHQRLLRARRTALHALILALGVPKQDRHAAYIVLRKALRYVR